MFNLKSLSNFSTSISLLKSIKVDPDKCIECYNCVSVCAANVFAKFNTPEKIINPKVCFNCGHCVLACPTDAVIHSDYPLDKLEKTKPIQITPNDFKNLVYQRHSVRNYHSSLLNEKDIEEITDIFEQSGSGHNLQNDKLILLSNKQLMSEIEDLVLFNSNFFKVKKEKLNFFKKLNLIYRGSPQILIVVSPKKMPYMSHLDAGIAIRNIELWALTKGLGSCHCGFLVDSAMNTDEIVKKLGYDPKDNFISGALLIGKPKFELSKFKIPRKERKVIIKE